MRDIGTFADWMTANHPGYCPIEEVWVQKKADRIMGRAMDRYAGNEDLEMNFNKLRAVLEKWMGGTSPNLQDPKVRIKIQQKTDHSVRVAATSYRAARKAGWKKKDASRNAVLVALHDFRERGQMPDDVAMGILGEFGFGQKEFDFLNHFTMTNKTTGADDTEDVFAHAQHAIGDHSDLDSQGKLRYILGKMSDRLDNLSKRVQLQWLRIPAKPKDPENFRKFEKLAADGPKYLAVSMDMLEMLAKAWRDGGGNRKTIRYFWDNLEQWVWGPLLKRYPELAAIRDDKNVRAQVRAGQADLLARYRSHPEVMAQVDVQRKKKAAKMTAYQHADQGVGSRPSIPGPPRIPATEWFRY